MPLLIIIYSLMVDRQNRTKLCFQKCSKMKVFRTRSTLIVCQIQRKLEIENHCAWPTLFKAEINGNAEKGIFSVFVYFLAKSGLSQTFYIK